MVDMVTAIPMAMVDKLILKITATGHVMRCVRYHVQLWQHQSNYIGVRLLPSLSYATLYLSTMSFTL